MKTFPIPTPDNQYEYLLRLYFGRGPNPLNACIGRAYRDLNRTLHGFAKLPTGKELRAEGSESVRNFLAGLAKDGSSIDQGSFDERHEKACESLCAKYANVEFRFHIGQAQKWLNMALKYVFAFGESRLPGYSAVYTLAHIPLDNIILDRLEQYDGGSAFPCLPTAWSRVDAYSDYMRVQEWVRKTFLGSAPLAVEFAVWNLSDKDDARE